MLRSGLFAQIPGDDSDAEAESEEEKPSTAEVLQRVKSVLGERWQEVPFMDLVPVQPGAKFASLARLMSDGRGFPPGFRIDRIHAPLVRETFLHNGFRPTKGEDWLISWTGPRMRDNVHRMMHEFQRVNHFPNSTELTRKDRMWENFQRMAQQHRELNFDFVPETFVLPQQLRSFKQRYLKTRSEQLWIVKPTASSQGRGIFILRNLVELPMKESVVVSRYVEKPLLIQGLKFDLRIYVMVTSFRPLRAYVYREGLTRFASKAYSTDEEHLADVYRHLTNYSINKGAENFQENQRVQADNYGHKWSLSALNRHLRCIGVNVKEMWSRIMDIIVKTLLAVEPAISAATKESCLHEQSCFELYGFDILVDEHLKPWLLEVNLSPSMQAESPLDKQIKSSLLSDAFNLLGVKRLDAQTLTSARLRARFLYMSKLQSQMPKSKDSKLLGHRQDPLRPEEPRLEKTEEPSVAEGDAEGEPQPLVRKYFSPKKQVSLSTLCEPHLRLLVYALEETQRCCNFIRLYPTPSTVKRYQPLTESRSMEDEFRNQLLTAVLFAQQMPLCDEPELEDKEPPPPEAELISAPEPEPVPKVAQEGNLQMVEEALQTLKVLGTKMSSQLLLMEYIVRLLNTCHQLSDGARRKLENRQQSAIAGVLQIFRQQLALYLRASERGARARGAHRAPAVPAAPAAELATGPSEELPGGSVVDDVEDICQQALVQILCNTWGGARDHAQRGVESLRGELSVVRCAPEAFAQSSSGCRAVAALGELSATDLESIFRAPQCPPEVKNLFLVPEDHEVGWNVLRRMSQAGPLSELEFLQRVTTTFQPPKAPLDAAKSPEDAPPLSVPRLMVSQSSPQLKRRPGPLAPLAPNGLAYSRKGRFGFGSYATGLSDIEL